MVDTTMNLLEWLRKQLGEADTDLPLPGCARGPRGEALMAGGRTVDG